MKLTAGLGSIDNYIPFAKAGVDEVFCGYVPYSWSSRHGMRTPLNRREVVYVNVQIGSESELKILRKMRDTLKVPVTLTLNSLSYTPEEYPELVEYMLSCKREGFSSFIIADPGLLVYLQNQEISGEFTLQISGELGEINHAMIAPLHELSASRIILHRKVSLPEMKKIISFSGTAGYPMEYEAFLLNEMCHFHGGFCNSLHCDELSHMCLVPYRYGPVHDTDSKEYMQPDFPGCSDQTYSDRGNLTGASGCGLCALWQLREAGVKWLKIVSRGASADQTIQDILAARQALQILEECDCQPSYISQMKHRLFSNGCSRNCYYYPIE